MITLAMVMALSMPPERYDHPPARRVDIVVVPSNLIDAACPDGRENFMLACYRTGTGKIYIRDDLTKDAMKRVLRHEYGHVNGWRH